MSRHHSDPPVTPGTEVLGAGTRADRGRGETERETERTLHDMDFRESTKSQRKVGRHPETCRKISVKTRKVGVALVLNTDVRGDFSVCFQH